MPATASETGSPAPAVATSTPTVAQNSTQSPSLAILAPCVRAKVTAPLQIASILFVQLEMHGLTIVS